LTANPSENSISAQAISRDGKYLTYTDFLSRSLYLLAIDSGELRQLPFSTQYQPVDWFADGTHLLLHITRRPADGGEPHKILTSPDASLSGLAWSPTGQRLAYLRMAGTTTNLQLTIETCDLSGSTKNVVLSSTHLWGGNGPHGIAWAARRPHHPFDLFGPISL